MLNGELQAAIDAIVGGDDGSSLLESRIDGPRETRAIPLSDPPVRVEAKSRAISNKFPIVHRQFRAIGCSVIAKEEFEHLLIIF